MSHLEYGSVVWVRLGQAWWPGTITTLEKCPPEFVEGLRKTPVAVVKFFNENEFQDVNKEEHIFPYSCDRKEEFIRRGQCINKNQSHGEVDLLRKFESDIVTAEKLTGGDMNILQTMGEVMGKRRVDYSDLGFGGPKTKKKKDEGSKTGSDIGQHVVYKKSGMRNNGKIKQVVIEHKVRILEQPKRETIEDSVSSSNWFKCYVCGFTCTRINVIVWHNKAHMKKVYDFDTGIKIPGRRRRKPGGSKANKDGKKKGRPPKGKNAVDHSHTNGEVSGAPKEGNNTQQLLQDWDDEEEEAPGTSNAANGQVEPAGSMDNDSNDGYSDDDDYPPPQPNHERMPMPKAADINSAFDALLAATPNVNNYSNQTVKYVSNDSDSDCSDWEKYYDKNSDSGDEENSQTESNDQSTYGDGFEKSNGVKSEEEEDKKNLSQAEMQGETEVAGETREEVMELMSKSESSSPLRIEEESSSKSISSDSVESKAFTGEGMVKKEMEQDTIKPTQSISQKSSADIYEYVDETCESPHEPYEPPKKPYESLQKYRLLQETYKTPHDSSRMSYYEEDKSLQEQHDSSRSESPEDRSLKAEDSNSEQVSSEHQMSGKEYPRDNVVEMQESSEQLPDYESSEEENVGSQETGHFTKDYEIEDEPDTAPANVMDVSQSETTHIPYEMEVQREGYEQSEQGGAYGQEISNQSDQEDGNIIYEEYRVSEGDDIENNRSRVVWKAGESSSKYYQSHKNEGYESTSGDATGEARYESKTDYKYGKFKSSKSYEFSQHSAQVEEKAYEAYNEQQLEDTGKPLEPYGVHKAYRSHHSKSGNSNVLHGYQSSELLPSEDHSRHRYGEEKIIHGKEMYASEVSQADMPLQEPIEHGKDVAAPTRDIEEFMKDTDRLTQNIDKLAENIDDKYKPTASVKDRIRKSFSEEYGEQTKEMEDMPQVLNLSTQDRSMAHEKEPSSSQKVSSESSALYSRSGLPSERVYHSKSGDHAVMSSSSGASYMLVAVDAHGNTVPTANTSSLSEGNGNLMAVEATLEDGATRTLYIDPTQLGPNADLNNLMLHIDNSGQEHVIIPSSSSSSEITGQEVSAYESQWQRVSEVQTHRRNISETSGHGLSHQSEGKSYHQVSYSGNYGERYSSNRGDNDHL